MHLYIVREGWNAIGGCSSSSERNVGVVEWMDGVEGSGVDGWSRVDTPLDCYHDF